MSPQLEAALRSQLRGALLEAGANAAEASETIDLSVHAAGEAMAVFERVSSLAGIDTWPNTYSIGLRLLKMLVEETAWNFHRQCDRAGIGSTVYQMEIRP